MSILINGMEMPIDGRHHKALLIFEPDGTGKCIVEYSESYSDRHIKTFEAIEIPTPHGRLIDADALYEKIADSFGGIDCAKLLDEDFAPTIIPEEDE